MRGCATTGRSPGERHRPPRAVDGRAAGGAVGGRAAGVAHLHRDGPMKRAPTYRTPLCPVAAAHGHLLDWPSAFAAWYCPSNAHDITPFFDSDLEPVRASRAADTRALLGSSTGRKSP